MEPGDFKKWRKAMRLSQKEAAHALGLKRRMIQYYEKGEREGEKVAIPLSVRLACFALMQNVADYHGPGRKIVRRDPDAADKDAREKDTREKDGRDKDGRDKDGRDRDGREKSGRDKDKRPKNPDRE